MFCYNVNMCVCVCVCVCVRAHDSNVPEVMQYPLYFPISGLPVRTLFSSLALSELQMAC